MKGGRRRPSGAGSNSTRMATATDPVTLKEVKIPTARSAATLWYVADADGNWPARETVMVDNESAWLREDDYIELQEMRPGEGMGDIVTYRVAEIRNRLRRFEGRYGQVMRRILLVPVADADLIADLGVDDLEVN